jgi:hypothetical protein
VKLLSRLTKVVLNTVLLPVDTAKDIVTGFGVFTDGECAIKKRCEKIQDTLMN